MPRWGLTPAAAFLYVRSTTKRTMPTYLNQAPSVNTDLSRSLGVIPRCSQGWTGCTKDHFKAVPLSDLARWETGIEDEHPGYVCIDLDFFERGRSAAGGWSAKQLAVLGIKWPPRKGWLRGMIGDWISIEDAERWAENAKGAKRG